MNGLLLDSHYTKTLKKHFFTGKRSIGGIRGIFFRGINNRFSKKSFVSNANATRREFEGNIKTTKWCLKNLEFKIKKKMFLHINLFNMYFEISTTQKMKVYIKDLGLLLPS